MQRCGLCLFRKPNDFYSTCTVLADKKGKLKATKDSPRPFWLPMRLRRMPALDMTTRTLATEGGSCAAYISTEVALAAP